MLAPISPSGPPYWEMMTCASFALGSFIFIGNCSLFHSSTSVTASFPGERGTAPAPVPAAFGEILAQWVMISGEFPLHLCFDPCVVIEVFHGFLIRRVGVQIQHQICQDEISDADIMQLFSSLFI